MQTDTRGLAAPAGALPSGDLAPGVRADDGGRLPRVPHARHGAAAPRCLLRHVLALHLRRAEGGSLE